MDLLKSRANGGAYMLKSGIHIKFMENKNLLNSIKRKRFLILLFLKFIIKIK